MKRILQADEPAFHAAYWRTRHDYDRGALNGETYWRAVAVNLGQTLSPDDHLALLEADVTLWTQPNLPMIDWAARLQAAGVRTGILSNLGDAMETGILVRCPWLLHFPHRTFSHRLGTAKPDPAIYAHAADGLGVAPETVLFIDDREDNIAAARAAGMQAIQYGDHPGFLKAMQAAGLEHLLVPDTNG